MCAPNTTCSNCEEKEQRIKALEELVAQLKEQVDKNAEEAEKKIKELQDQLARAKKNSRNSSKPSSSDITNPQPKKKKTGKKSSKKRKRGGQPGHKRHEREPFQEHEIDDWWEYRYQSCPGCGGGLEDSEEPPKTMQHVEFIESPIRIEEHHRIGQWCPNCQTFHCVPFPEELLKAGLVGPRLTALVAYLKSVCHMSFSNIRKFFRDCVGVRISRGMLRKLIAKVSESIKDPYDALLDALLYEPRLNVDETGHKDSGQRLWTWCFRAELFTVFKVSRSRGSQVLLEVLGKAFEGVIGCDYFSAYRKYMKDFDIAVQFCLAHLIRDVKFLCGHPDSETKAYGRRLLELLRKLFRVIHQRDQHASEATFEQALTRVREAFVTATHEAPSTREALNLEARFTKHADSYFRFITTPGVEPTNNLAEQAIRFVAIHRRMTQGTRGDSGQRWWERICTVVVTCNQQGRSPFTYLHQAVVSHFRGEPAPTLSPDISSPDTS